MYSKPIPIRSFRTLGRFSAYFLRFQRSVPRIEQRVNPPSIQRLTPSWPDKHSFSSPADAVPSLSFLFLAVDSIAADRQKRQTKESEDFYNGIYHDIIPTPALMRAIGEPRYIESESIVTHRDRSAIERLSYSHNDAVGIVRNMRVDF